MGYVQKPYTTTHLETVVDVAYDNGVPVIVNAAAELPTTDLFRFVEAGTDPVVIGEEKAIRGPQSTGVPTGRRDLVESAAVQDLDVHASTTDRCV